MEPSLRVCKFSGTQTSTFFLWLIAAKLIDSTSRTQQFCIIPKRVALSSEHVVLEIKGRKGCRHPFKALWKKVLGDCMEGGVEGYQLFL